MDKLKELEKLKCLAHSGITLGWHHFDVVSDPDLYISYHPERKETVCVYIFNNSDHEKISQENFLEYITDWETKKELYFNLDLLFD